MLAVFVFLDAWGQQINQRKSGVCAVATKMLKAFVEKGQQFGVMRFILNRFAQT